MAKSKNKRDWKKIVLGVVGGLAALVVVIIIGIFLWFQSWKTFTFPQGGVSFKYPSNDVVVPSPYEKSIFNIIEKNYFNLELGYTVCNITKYSDKETCGEKSAEEGVVIYATDTHPFITQIPDNIIYINGHKAHYMVLSTRVGGLDSKDIFSETSITFNNKDIVYSLHWHNSFANPKLIDNKEGLIRELYSVLYNKLIIQLMINSINFH